MRDRGSKRADRGVSMSEMRFLNWRGPYLEALRETDQRKLAGLVDHAESAILSRMDVIQSGGDRVEKLAIEDALSALVVLKRETASSRRIHAQANSAIQSKAN
jgi:hypothetical protein